MEPSRRAEPAIAKEGILAFLPCALLFVLLRRCHNRHYRLYNLFFG
jgi:hypothetical protein